MRMVVLLLLVSVLFSCNKEDDSVNTKLDLVFELRYDGEPLSGPQEWYEINDSVQMQFTKVSFYLSDFKLTSESATLSLVDVLHVSFLQNTSGDAIQEKEQTLKFDVPSGNYSSLSLGLGLTPSQNASVPADHEPGSALSLTSEYWPAWESYIFEKIEGNYKVNDELQETVTLHVGGDETFRVLEWKDGLTLKGGENKRIIIPIDLKYILEDYPLTEAPRLHKLDQLPYMNMIADGFSDSMNN